MGEHIQTYLPIDYLGRLISIDDRVILPGTRWGSYGCFREAVVASFDNQRKDCVYVLKDGSKKKTRMYPDALIIKIKPETVL